MGAYRINHVFGANHIVDVVASCPIINILYEVDLCDEGVAAMKGKGYAPSLSAIMLLTFGILSFRVAAWVIYRSDFAYITNEGYMIARLFQMFVVVGLMVAMRNKIPSRKVFVGGMVLAAAAMFAASFVVILCSDGVLSSSWGMAACGLHGAASAFFFLGWGVCACLEPPARSSLSITLAFLLYGLVTLFLSFSPLWLVEGVALVSPLFCCLLIVAALKEKLGKIPSGRASLRRDLDTPSRMVLGVMLACCVICAVVDVMVPESSDPSLYSFNAFWPILYALIFGVFFVWFVLMGKKEPDALWPLFTVVLSIGLFGFSSFFFIDAFVAGQFMRASADCIIVFSWVFVACMVYRKKLQPVFYFGLSIIVYSNTAPFPKAAFDALFPQIDFGAGSLVAIALAFAMAVVLIGCAAFLSVAKKPSALPETVQVLDAGRSGLEWMKERHGLTPREIEVVDLLTRGYTMPQTGERLFISHDTVRSHVKSIYKKLGVHSKKELIDIVSQGGGD